MRSAALASALTALPAAAMPSVPAVDLSNVRGGAGQQEARNGRQAPSISIAGGAIAISVQAAAGQSPEQIAAEVERRLSARLNAISRGAFSDGAN